MPLNVHSTHILVNSQCASAGLRFASIACENVRMKRTYLREWRKAAGKTLEQVAVELGITNQQLGKIERGLQPYNQKLIEFLAELYGCDETDLLKRPPGQSMEVVQMWDRVPVADRPRALAVLEAFTRTGTGG